MKATKLMKTSPSVISFAAIGGKKENEGPLGDYFDKINDDPYLSTDSFEKGESQLQKQAVLHALDKAALSPEDIDVLFGGDLLNQCVGTTYGVRAFEMPFLGIYGACSTMLRDFSSPLFSLTTTSQKSNGGHIFPLLHR